LTPKSISWEGKILDAGEGTGGAYLEIPFDVAAVFGKKRIKIVADFEGIPYRGTLAVYGGIYMLLVLKSIRSALGKQIGDTIKVTVTEDIIPRIIEPPEDFYSILKEHPEALEFYEKSSFTCKKEYVNWINSAKKPETRKSRIKKAIEMLQEKKSFS
jgi:hypothetical protein